MPRYDRLSVDIDAEPWSLTDVPPQLSGSAAPDVSGPPLALRVDGASAGALMLARRGAQSDATTDLVVSPGLGEVLRGFRLPRHAAIPCAAVREPFDVRRMRMRKRTEPALPYVWLWWQESFARRIDFGRSTFFLRYASGGTAEASYEALEDFEQVVRRAVSTLELDIAPAELEWTEADVYALDLVPLGLDVFLSKALADALRRASLPGLRVLPPRTSATLLA